MRTTNRLFLWPLYWKSHKVAVAHTQKYFLDWKQLKTSWSGLEGSLHFPCHIGLMELTRWDRYVRNLLELSLEPLIRHGIGLGFNAQNTVVRICRRTNDIKGFAIRDMAGVKLHGTTLQDQGFNLTSLEASVAQDVHEVWDTMHHGLIQDHIGHLLDSLGLELHGWQIVSFELERALQGEVDSVEQGIYRHFVKETMPFKSLIRMRMDAPLNSVRIPLIVDLLINNLANVQASFSRSFINKFPVSCGRRVHGFVKYHWPLQRVCLHSSNQSKRRNEPVSQKQRP
jgi:hypothetical protein